ncbi:MAG: TMEM165/GDT1 family protein [Nitrososphaerales archaeon]|jgi:putative Ca2+/H+ antiporter (TMEM165/GDT1 family)
MVDPLLVTLATIASALFVTELTDKDAFLLLTLAARTHAATVFFAGATAFVITTTIFVTVGTLISAAVPIFWVRLVGGAFMIGYGLWEARGVDRRGDVEKEERSMERRFGGWTTFFTIVAGVALLDIAGDATEVLTIVLAARYSNPVLVFSAASIGLVSAAAFETVLGNRLGRMLTPHRIRYVSMVVFLVLGTFIIVSTLP